MSDRPGTALHAKKEVPSGRKLDLDNVERRETYIGTGGGYIIGIRQLDFYNVGIREP